MRPNQRPGAGATLLITPQSPISTRSADEPEFKPPNGGGPQLRKAFERTVEEPWSAIGRLVDPLTPDEHTNLFAAAGSKPNNERRTDPSDLVKGDEACGKAG